MSSVKAGANGYLLKEIAIEEIGAMVRAIVQRQGVISPFMTSKLLAEFRALAKRADERVELGPTRPYRPRDASPAASWPSPKATRRCQGPLHL